MKKLRYILLATLTLFTLASTTIAAQSARAMVATVNPLATEAGLNAIRDGGNAVDAAVAAALTLGVVDGHNSGIGGGCFILIHAPGGEVVAIDGRETAPTKSSRDMFVVDGKVDPNLSKLGPLAVGTPGALAAYQKALDLHGRLSLKQAVEPAAEIAERGFTIDRVYAARLTQHHEALKQFPASSRVLLNPNGSPHMEGDIIRQPDLATTYRKIANQGTKWFYDGEFAKQTARWMAANGGMLTAEDFRKYEAKVRKPIRTKYRKFEIIGFPPPSSGGIHVAQVLNLLERFNLKEIHQKQPATYFHLTAEAMKLAFADRAYWLGDADFATVPKGLIDKRYANHLGERISPKRVGQVDRHGMPKQWDADDFNRHTTHIAAADEEGYWVGITATVNTSFGSKIVVPSTGVILNNQMDDFSAQPGVPNAFGLIGAENNAIEPGKRPLSSMSPTIVLHKGKPIMTVGAAGGPKIITQVIQTIINHLDLEMPMDTAVARSRLHHQWFPDTLMVESTFPVDMINQLQNKGHEVTVLSSGGVTQAIGRAGNQFIGVSDPRIPGKAGGL